MIWVLALLLGVIGVVTALHFWRRSAGMSVPTSTARLEAAFEGEVAELQRRWIMKRWPDFEREMHRENWSPERIAETKRRVWDNEQ